MRGCDHVERWPWLEEVERVLGSDWAITLGRELQEGTLVDLGPVAIDTGRATAAFRQSVATKRPTVVRGSGRGPAGRVGQLTLDGRTE